MLLIWALIEKYEVRGICMGLEGGGQDNSLIQYLGTNAHSLLVSDKLYQGFIVLFTLSRDESKRDFFCN